jgi:hypothetical protein
MWSQRDNNNYEESALLSTLAYFSRNTHHFLENYYMKSKRSVQKPTLDGPAAYVLPADAAELNRQLQLLNVLKLQHVEVQQLSEPLTSSVPPTKRGDKPTTQTFPAGSYVVRLDQPFSRVADALLDKQYWAPDDQQKHPYDDTGWSFTQLFNVKAVRLTDAAILKAPMTPAVDIDQASGKISGSGSGSGTVYAIANTGQTSLLPLVYALKQAHVETTEKAFDVEGKHFGAGSLLITQADEPSLAATLRKLSLDATRLSAAPSVATHPAAAPRIAFMHTWLGTQTEGWWRLAFDKAGVPFSYISTQTAALEGDLRGKYDVIVFAPVGRSSSQEIINGLPKWGNALPWQKSEITPNLGLLDSTPDMREGLGYDGLAHLKTFVEKGGLLITCEDTAQFAIDTGLAPGVSVAPHDDARVVGSVLNSVFVAPSSPIANGYGASLPVISANGMVFNVSNTLARQGGRMLMDPYEHRPTGRGGPDDSDITQGRQLAEPEVLPKQQPWQPKQLNEDQMRNNLQVIPVQYRPEVILRFSEQKTLLLSGLLDKAGSIAERAIVVNAHLGEGNVLLFANNPVYRGETIGSYDLVFNAILNYDHLRQPIAAPAPDQPAAKAAPAER